MNDDSKINSDLLTESPLKNFIARNSKNYNWADGCIKGYTLALESMIAADLDGKRIAEILGESDEMIDYLLSMKEPDTIIVRGVR